MSIRENEKFRRAANDDSSNKPHSLKDFVSDIKRTFGLKYAHLLFPLSSFGFLTGIIECMYKTQWYKDTIFMNTTIRNVRGSLEAQ